MIRVFNKELNGIDVEKFCQKSKEDKFTWIKNNTNQQNDSIINDFLNKPLLNEDCGCGCGGHKSKENGNISNGIPKEIATVSEVTSTSRNNKPRNTKRRGINKGS